MDQPERPRSILAHLALQFGGQRELWATAALGHLLASSPVCEQTLQHMLNDRGALLPEHLAYRTEVVDVIAEGRPDIVGAIGGSRHVIVEGKFWASLTDSQPVDYLRSLAVDGCLLVVAPHRRIQILESELVTRCEAGGLSVLDDRGPAEVRLRRVDDSWWMGVVSWRVLLGRLRSALQDASDPRLAADVEQLDSLCDLADSDAFLPLNSDDLSNPTPLRVLQYMQLVERVATLGGTKGRFQLKGYRPSGPMGKYIRYLAADQMQIALTVDLVRWSKHRYTPLWLELWVEPGNALRGLELTQPPRVSYDGPQGRPVIGLPLALNVEESAVVDHVYAQVLQIVDLVHDCPRTVAVQDPDAPPVTPEVVP